MFTVEDVFIMAEALTGDSGKTDDTDAKLSVHYMNVLLQEALPAENSIRAAHDEQELAEAPTVGDISDGIIYHDKIVRAAFPYGLAWQCHQDAGNLQLAAMYRNMFIDAVEDSKMIVVR